METTKNVIPAEIVLNAISGTVYIFVNGEQVGAAADTPNFMKHVEAHLKAAHVYRQTGFVNEGGAMIAEGQRVVAA